MIFFVLPQHKCFVLVVGFIIMLKVEGIFETQQSIGLEWRDPRLQVEEELQTKKILKRPQIRDSLEQLLTQWPHEAKDI